METVLLGFWKTKYSLKVTYLRIKLVFIIFCVFISEPGYYKENDFGMRLENLVRVIELPVRVSIIALKNILT